jgi:hypothetical protein
MKKNMPPLQGESLHAYWVRVGGNFGTPTSRRYPTGWYSRAWLHGEKFGCRWVVIDGSPIAQY